ncbi:MAG TPA: hypothetical protein VK763_00265 [Terriglobales bacterium]|jgi:hypothetical protein|nr:hypothetical protein [Terriglobales bacterium]
MNKTQTQRLYELLLDGKSHRSDEIVEKIYGTGLSLARVGARVYDVQKKYGVKIKGWHDPQNPKLYWYGIVRQNFVMPPTFPPAPDRPSHKKDQQQNLFV